MGQTGAQQAAPPVHAPAPPAPVYSPPAAAYAPPQPATPPMAYEPVRQAAPPPFYTQQQPAAAPPPPPATQTSHWVVDTSAPAPQQETYIIPPPKSGLPSWAVVLLVAVVLIAAGYAGITFLRPGPAKPDLKTVPAADAAKQVSPFARNLEIAGLRVVESANRKLEVHLIVINHSAAELPELKLAVNLRPTTAAPDSDPISTFTVKVPPLGAFESKDLKAEAVTKLRAYEFPDWQFLKADFQVVSP
ncbi:MAG: hypothetical protein LC126_22400 [Bryobacterales bacterium]|nr:hypothetical protein [Bryobacterales bacterium]